MVITLMEDYNGEILHRDEQYRLIKKNFELFKRDGFANNILVQGVTGSGKTATIKKIINEEESCFYVDCKEYNTTKKIFAYFSKKRNIATCDIINKFIEELKDNKKVLIFDEVHRVKDIFCFVDTLNMIYRRVSVPIIIITNQFNFLTKIPEDARLTLFFQTIGFDAYNALQLGDILRDRLAKIDGINFPEISINQLCAYVVKNNFCSARVCLDIAKKCIQNNNYEYDFIIAIAKEMDSNELLNFVYKLNSTEKNFLSIVLELVRENKEITSADIAKQMCDITLSRVSQLITIFCKEYLLLEERYLNFGVGGGKYRLIRFRNDADKSSLYSILHPERGVYEES
jgi:Cdc6-like AAA superfamily ATPase